MGVELSILHVDDVGYWHQIRQAYQSPRAAVQNDYQQQNISR